MNLIEEKVGNSLKLVGTGENFLNRTQMVEELRTTVNKHDLKKLKSFCMTKDTVETPK